MMNCQELQPECPISHLCKLGGLNVGHIEYLLIAMKYLRPNIEQDLQDPTCRLNAMYLEYLRQLSSGK